MRIAHLSDLHFSTISLSPLQFFSKRWIGNFNHIFRRRNLFSYEPLEDLVEIFRSAHVDLILITGDLSTTGRKEEFRQAKVFCYPFEKFGIKVFALPGNHDHYTKRGYRKKHFYDYFYDKRLKTEGITSFDLNCGWSLVALDTALATALNSSRGLFSHELEERLLSLLSSFPKDRHILLANHFPLFGHEQASKILERAPYLRELLKQFPNVRLYLHGHTHAHCVADLRANGLPIIVDSGSITHRDRGTWNLIDLQPQGIKIRAFKNVTEPFGEHTWIFP